MSKEVEITIKAKMNERWVNDFLSMLKYMESCGNMGHSAVVGFYSDGDGDFRPKFEFDREYSDRNLSLIENMNYSTVIGSMNL